MSWPDLPEWPRRGLLPQLALPIGYGVQHPFTIGDAPFRRVVAPGLQPFSQG
jgi:hypothetical protein